MSAHPTPAQTIGPFFGFGLPWREGPNAVAEGTAGAIRIRGQLLDGAGDPISDGLIETWQTSPAGIRGFARSATDGEGRYAILTVKPGSSRDRAGTLYAPHIAVSVFARGLLKRVVTRIYFADERAANDADPVLAGIPDPALRATLVASAVADGYRFDIRLQGQGETVFFDV